MGEQFEKTPTGSAKTQVSEMNRRLDARDKDIRVALRWFGTHLLAVLVCLLMTVSFVTFTKNLLIQAILLFFIFLLYVLMMGGGAWRLGSQDHNRVKFGHKKQDLSRGFRVATITSIPLWVFGVTLLLAKAEFLPNFYSIYKIINNYALVFINLVDGTFFGNQSIYLTSDSWAQIIGVFLLNFLPALICGIQYILGYRDIAIFEKIIYKNKKR